LETSSQLSCGQALSVNQHPLSNGAGCSDWKVEGVTFNRLGTPHIDHTRFEPFEHLWEPFLEFQSKRQLDVCSTTGQM
jgi:hypothetical protein